MEYLPLINMNGTKKPINVKKPLHVSTTNDGDNRIEKSNIVVRVCIADL